MLEQQSLSACGSNPPVHSPPPNSAATSSAMAALPELDDDIDAFPRNNWIGSWFLKPPFYGNDGQAFRGRWAGYFASNVWKEAASGHDRGSLSETLVSQPLFQLAVLDKTFELHEQARRQRSADSISLFSTATWIKYTDVHIDRAYSMAVSALPLLLQSKAPLLPPIKRLIRNILNHDFTLGLDAIDRAPVRETVDGAWFGPFDPNLGIYPCIRPYNLPIPVAIKGLYTGPPSDSGSDDAIINDEILPCASREEFIRAVRESGAWPAFELEPSWTPSPWQGYPRYPSL